MEKQEPSGGQWPSPASSLCQDASCSPSRFIMHSASLLGRPTPSRWSVNTGDQLLFSVGQHAGLCSQRTVQDSKSNSQRLILLWIQKPAWESLGRVACCQPFTDVNHTVVWLNSLISPATKKKNLILFCLSTSDACLSQDPSYNATFFLSSLL